MPRAENCNAYFVTKLDTSNDAELLKLVAAKILETPAIECKPEAILVDLQLSWKDLIVKYLIGGELSEDRQYAKRLKY